MTARIALDAMGGDRGPEEMVAGAVRAVNEYDLQVILLGDEGRLAGALKGHRADPDRLRIVHTSQAIGMEEQPFEAVRRKKDASIVVAFDQLRAGAVDAVVSAGNSGAIMAAAIRKLGRLPHVARPGIASIFPSLKEPVVMMDAGANVDCRPQHLFQFGVMASAFSRVLLGKERPRVGLLSIGEEGGKGNLLVKGARELFLKSSLNFVGNVEGRDIFQGEVDVIVCDGFVGNVCLKVSEGLAEAIMAMLRAEMSKSVFAKLGYLLARGAFAGFRRRVDYAEYGGAPLLGMNGTGIVCHGRSNAVAIKNAIRVAADLVSRRVNDQIMNLMSSEEAVVLGPDSGLVAADTEEAP